MFFGLTMEKLVVITVIAALIIGPERLPAVARSLREGLRRVTHWTRDMAKDFTNAGGEGVDDIDWRRLDPRQYDPRRIIREALLEDSPAPAASEGSAASRALTAEPATKSPPSRRGPYDTAVRDPSGKG